MTAPVPPDANAWPKGRLVAHPQPGKVWVQVPHRNDIGSDWIEADELVPPDANGLREAVHAEVYSENANAVLHGVTGTHPESYGGVTKDEALECAADLIERVRALLAASEAAPGVDWHAAAVEATAREAETEKALTELREAVQALADACEDDYQRSLRAAGLTCRDCAYVGYHCGGCGCCDIPAAGKSDRASEECGAIPPNVGGPVPCHLPLDHEGEHFSTSGCAGSEICWTTPATPPADDASEVEALAKVLHAVSCPEADHCPGPLRRDLAAAECVLASPWLAARESDAATRARAEGATEAWDEGYEAAIGDTEARSAPPGPCRPVDPTSNPYARSDAAPHTGDQS